MPIIKAIPKKKSGRILIAVRKLLFKEMKFEVWLQQNHPKYYEEARLIEISQAIAKLNQRIKRASERERAKTVQTVIA